jgi:hypothetical protein
MTKTVLFLLSFLYSISCFYSFLVPSSSVALSHRLRPKENKWNFLLGQRKDTKASVVATFLHQTDEVDEHQQFISITSDERNNNSVESASYFTDKQEHDHTQENAHLLSSSFSSSSSLWGAGNVEESSKEEETDNCLSFSSAPVENQVVEVTSSSVPSAAKAESTIVEIPEFSSFYKHLKFLIVSKEIDHFCW